MPDTQQVKVTAQDIQSVNDKLQAFAKGLPKREQNVMAWLLGRAAQAPAEQPHFLGEPAAGAAKKPGPRGPLNEALGIAQFRKLQPGSTVAGSSIGVTGTVMF